MTKRTRRNNVFIERLRRSVKHEEVHLRTYGSVSKAVPMKAETTRRPCLPA